MDAEEWALLADLLAIVENAVCDACEFVANHMEREIKGLLFKAGASDVPDAYQQVHLELRRKLCQLRDIELFECWLRRVVHSAAKKSRKRCIRYSKVLPQTQEMPARPKELGSKTITIDGNPHIVRVFEPALPQEERSQRWPVFEPVSDGILANASMSNRPNYPCKIDLWEAIAKLPLTWALAILVVYVLGFSAAEAAQIMGCSVDRVNKLLQKAKQRMRELLPQCVQNGKVISESDSRPGTAAPGPSVVFRFQMSRNMESQFVLCVLRVPEWVGSEAPQRAEPEMQMPS